MRAMAGKVPLEERYEIRLVWSDEDEVFVALFPDFPFVGAHGDTPEEALAEAKAAIRGAIEVAREKGKPIPQPKFRQAV